MYDHPQTRRGLENWAGYKCLVMASYFLWIQGNAIQKSQEGLLSALLENILTECSKFVLIVAPVWSESTLWSFKELDVAFLLRIDNSKFPVKFCFSLMHKTNMKAITTAWFAL